MPREHKHALAKLLPIQTRYRSSGARTQTRCRGRAAGNIDQQRDYFCALINSLSIKNQNRVAYDIE